MDTLELKTGEKIKVLNGACMEAKIKDNLPVMSGKVGNKNVEVLRDSGCNGVMVNPLRDNVTRVLHEVFSKNLSSNLDIECFFLLI